MAQITVRYWAGAAAAAGVDEDTVSGASVGDVLAQVRERRPAVSPVLQLAAVLLEGRRVASDAVVHDGDVLEVLPPFAGG